MQLQSGQSGKALTAQQDHDVLLSCLRSTSPFRNQDLRQFARYEEQTTLAIPDEMNPKLLLYKHSTAIDENPL